MNDLLSGRWWDGKLGAVNMKNQAMRATNPFLSNLYTRQTWLIMLAGWTASLLQGRIMAAFAPLALLTMDFSKDGAHTLYACLAWSGICVLYWLYMVWVLGLW